MAKKAAAKKTKKVPVYQYKKIGTVSVDVGTILIADPCRVNSIAATQTLDAGGHPDMVDSPLMPRGTCFNTLTGEGAVEELAREIVDPATPNRVPNPTRLEDYGTSEGTFVTLKTGFGDGYYDVYAETVNYGDGPLGGERIAAIHMQFVADEDLVPYRGSKKMLSVEVDFMEEIITKAAGLDGEAKAAFLKKVIRRHSEVLVPEQFLRRESIAR